MGNESSDSVVAEAKRLLISDAPALAGAGARILARAETADAHQALRHRLLDPNAPAEVLSAICASLPGDFEVDARLARHLFPIWTRTGLRAIAHALENGASHLDSLALIPTLLNDRTYDDGLRLLVLSRSPVVYDGATEWLYQNDGHDHVFTVGEYARIEDERIPRALLGVFRHRCKEGIQIDASDFARAFASRLPDRFALRGLAELAQSDCLAERIAAIRALESAGFSSWKIVEGLLEQLPECEP